MIKDLANWTQPFRTKVTSPLFGPCSSLRLFFGSLWLARRSTGNLMPAIARLGFPLVLLVFLNGVLPNDSAS